MAETSNRIERKYAFSIMVRQAPDLPGQWVSHCLELDVISQGDDPSDAVKSIVEAIQHTFVDDIESRQTRQPAPDSYWNDWFAVMNNGQQVVSDDQAVRFTRLATILHMHVVVERVDDSERAKEVEQFGPPPAWMIDRTERKSGNPSTYQ